MAAKSAEHAHFLKRPVPLAFCFAAFFLPAAIMDLDLCWPFARLPPTKRTFFAFFFLRFFFFFAFFFFFFFFFFLAFGFFAFLAFLAFFGAFLAGFFFAAVFTCVRASVSLRMRRFVATLDSQETISSANTMSALSLVPL